MYEKNTVGCKRNVHSLFRMRQGPFCLDATPKEMFLLRTE